MTDDLSRWRCSASFLLLFKAQLGNIQTLSNDSPSLQSLLLHKERVGLLNERGPALQKVITMPEQQAQQASPPSLFYYYHVHGKKKDGGGTGGRVRARL